MIPLAKDFGHTIGIDPSLPDLILAKKAAIEAGVADPYHLIQGHVQRMPLPAESIDFALAEDVLEHVMDLDGAMRDIGRVLRRQGVFVGNSVNRFNMFCGPNLHVKLWFMGFLAATLAGALRPLAARVSLATTKAPTYPPIGSSAGALRSGIGSDSQVTFPDVATFGFSPKLGRVLDVIDGFHQWLCRCCGSFPAIWPWAGRADDRPGRSAKPYRVGQMCPSRRGSSKTRSGWPHIQLRAR